MADRVASNTMWTAQERKKIIQFYNVSDGTGESSVVKISRAALSGPSSPIRILRIWGSALGMTVNIFFDATNDDLIHQVLDGQPIYFDYRDFGGLKDPQSAGTTGDVLFTTVGHTLGDTYSIVVEFTW
jgi:hypothetical protein